MECLSDTSVEDFDDLSEPEDKKVALMAQCVGKQIEIPSTSRNVPNLAINKVNAEPAKGPDVNQNHIARAVPTLSFAESLSNRFKTRHRPPTQHFS